MKDAAMQDGMMEYAGMKMVKALSMTRGEYNSYRNWSPPEGEDQSVAGHLVEYMDGGMANHPGHQGYISWSPADVFERSYRLVDGMPFGHALEALKGGARIARRGWNGKGMFLFLLPAADRLPTKIIHDPALRRVIEDEVDGETFDALGSIRIFTSDRKVLTGWNASQTDMLSDDWEILG